MERNDNFGSTGGMGENTSGSGSFGSSSSGSTSGSAGYGSGSTESGLGGGYGAGGANYGSTSTQGGFGTESGAEGRIADAKEKLGNAKDAAADKLSGARDAAGDKLGALKEKASHLSATLADKLEAGAEKLRGQGGASGGSMAFAGSTGASAGTQDERMAAINNRLAGGMQGAADWLREGDLRATIETQVKEHPGRTLLIALGVGYVLGKTFRK